MYHVTTCIKAKQCVENSMTARETICSLVIMQIEQHLISFLWLKTPSREVNAEEKRRKLTEAFDWIYCYKWKSFIYMKLLDHQGQITIGELDPISDSFSSDVCRDLGISACNYNVYFSLSEI